MPIVSVIIPSYNHETYIEECLQSVLNQTFQDFEIIVTDDGSTDRTVEIIEGFDDPRIRLFKHTQNKGTPAAINNCILHANGKYIAALGSDDAWYPEKLAAQVRFLEGHPDIAAIFSRVDWVDETGAILAEEQNPLKDVFEVENRNRFEWLNRFFLQGNCLNMPSSLIRAACLREIGLLNPVLANLHDFDLWVRICLKHEIFILDAKLVRYRWMSNNENLSASTKQTHIRSHFEYKQVLNNFLDVKMSDELLSIFPDALQYGRVTAKTIPYFLGRVAIDSGSDFRTFWGEEVIFALLQDEKIAQELEKNCNFTYPDFFNIVKRNDTYKYFVLQDLYGTIDSLNQELAEIRTSREWRLVLLLRRLKQSIAPPGSRRAHTIQRAWNLFLLPYTQFSRRGKFTRDLALIRSSSFFDRDWYLENNPDLAQAKVDPERHYLLTGGFEGRDPGPNFSSRWYMDMYQDVRKSGLNPLVHYLRYGQHEGRVASAADLSSQNSATYKSYKTIVANRKESTSFKRWSRDRLLRTAFVVNQRLPLSEPGRQKFQRIVYKLFPSFFYTYKRSVNEIASEKYFPPGKTGNRHPSFKGILAEGDDSQLTLWSHLLRMSETSLLSLLVPPWHLGEPNASMIKSDEEQATKKQHPQTLFTILLFVSNPPAHFLYECIKSVQTQTYQNWQLVIFVREEGVWNEDVLDVQFESDPHIQVRSIAYDEEIPDILNRSVREATGSYVLLLSQYDQLKQDALKQTAIEIENTECDLIYSPVDLPAEAIYMDLSDPRFSSADLFHHGFAFSQFILWRKTYLESLLPDGLSSPSQILSHVRQEITGSRKPQSVGKLTFSCYSYREIPERLSVILSVRDENVDLTVCFLPLRILVDGRLLGRQTTGSERYIWELLTELASLRKEIQFSLKAITLSEPKEQIEGVTFLTSAHLEAMHECHIFHKTFPASDAGTLAEMGVPPSVVYSPLDMILYSNPDYFFNEMDYYHFRKTMQLSVKLSNQIISISKHGKMEMEVLLKVPDSRITPVYLGVRPEHFSLDERIGRSKLDQIKVPSNYFLFVGTNYPHKNLVMLLRALKVVIKQIPDVNLVIVGTNHFDQPQPELDDLLSQLSTNILRLGHVPDGVLPSLYHFSCALVYPSLHEGFGLPLLEAMLCGTAVIASNSTSIPEVCGEESAILVDGRDENQIAEAMIKVWRDPETRNRLIAAGYKNAARFSWGNTARQTLECYRETVNRAIGETFAKRTREKADIINDLGVDPPTVLIVAHIRIYPPAAGNEQRVLQLVKYLKKLGYRVILLVNPFLEQSKLDRNARRDLHQYVDYYEEIGDVPLDRKDLIPVNPQIGNEPILGRWKITEVTYCPDAILERAAYLIEQFSPKMIVANYIWMSRVLALATPEMLKVIDTHDMFSRKNESVARFGIQTSLATTPEEELAFLNRSDVIIAIQESEAEAFRKLGPTGRVITAGIDLDLDRVHENRNDETRSPSLLIIGSGNQINVHCVKEFLEEAWPPIHRQIPACRLRIVGKVTKSLTIDDPAVVLIPYVEDLDTVYEEAAVVINPVYAGTGIKVKSIEALGHGKAFVCWPEGAAGLTSREPDPFIIIESWDELVESVVDLLGHPEKRQELEKAAGHFARTRLSDRVIYREIADCFDAFSKRKLNVLCLYLRYGLNDHPQGLSDLQDWYARKMTGAQTTTWIIDNKLETEVDGVDLVTGFRLLSGDNQQREFSAFQKILIEHRAEIEKYDVVHFVTSAFNTLFTGYLDYFQAEQLSWVAHRPICLGHIDAYDEPIQLTGETSQSWIRTCFFFMSPETVYSIPDFVSFRQESQFFNAEGKFLRENGLSENYKQYISGWLHGETMQGVSWHSTIPNPKAFTGKTLAILNEHMLAIQLRKAGIHLVDYFWMRRYSQDFSSSMDLPIPDSLEQVKFRQAQLFGRVNPDPMAV